MELEIVNKLFLELSQFSNATTAKELALERRIDALQAWILDAVEELREEVRGCCGLYNPPVCKDCVRRMKLIDRLTSNG